MGYNLQVGSDIEKHFFFCQGTEIPLEKSSKLGVERVNMIVFSHEYSEVEIRFNLILTMLYFLTTEYNKALISNNCLSKMFAN